MIARSNAPRSTQSRILLILVSVALVAASALPLGCSRAEKATATERVATTQAAIGDGTKDSSGAFNGVARVWLPERDRVCSGVLLTPLYIGTANHCVTGVAREGLDCLNFFKDTEYTGGDVTQDVDVDFHSSGNGFYTPRRKHSHTGPRTAVTSPCELLTT